MELVASGPRVGTICTCGTEISYPEVYNTGVRPNERAAERLRYKAFRAAGLVKNVGGFAMGLAFLGILFFPLALVGAVLGMYVLTMVRGPLGRYSGRNAALVAITVGIGVFATEVSIVWSYVAHRRTDRIVALQTSASDDLRTLLRTQRLFRAAQDRYGSLKESHFQPRGGAYTIYLGADDYVAAMRDDQTVTDALPPGLHPKITPEAFTAYAVANLDGDPELDVWSVDDAGDIKHLTNDVPWVELPAVPPSGKEQNEEPATPLIVPDAVKTETAKDGKLAKVDTAKADAGKSDATKAAEKAKADADTAKAAADKAKADADKAKADADKAIADADKAKAEAEKAKAEAEKATAAAKAAPMKVDAATIEAAKADAAKGADKMKSDAAKATADRAKADADKAKVEAAKAKADAEKAKVEAAKADKAKTEAAKADVGKAEKPKTEAPKADVTPEKSKTDG